MPTCSAPLGFHLRSLYRALCVVLLLLATASGVQAANYRTCIRLQIKTVDSGIGIPSGPNAGGTEDYYITANAGVDAIARGVRVRMSRGDWSQVYDAEPSTGCFNWSSASTSGFSMRVYGYATLGDNNVVRIHDAPDSFTSYPGATYSILRSNLSPTAGGTDTYAVGSYDPKWTTFAVLAFGLYRYNAGLSDKTIHVGLNPANCSDASAHYGESNAHITEGRHYIKLGNCTWVPGVSTPITVRKFIVSHELGHAIAALYYGGQEGAVDGGEPALDTSHAAQGSCTGGSSYSMRSVEWSSVNFREAFAHFVAAVIWNNPTQTEAAFHWFESSTYDLERYNFGAGTESGGRMENECGTPYTDASTNEDWMRFFWDFYTNTSDSCPQRPTTGQMLQLYAQTRLNGGLTSRNYYDKMRAAAQQLDLPSCVKAERFDSVADFNGINH